MLEKINRIRKKKDFEVFFKKGVSFKKNFLILKTTSNNLETKRFGFIVSQKVSKKAVVRNLIRRRLNEAVKLNFENVKNGVDCVFIVLSGAEKTSFLEVKNDVKNLLEKANLTK
jgi:ribonuclease P protein component